MESSRRTDRAKVIGEDAVVLGASMAGLCAARVLADRFTRVVVLDRDALPEGPEARRHVPQGRHPHLLLVAGARLLEQWFSGLVGELHRAGAVDLDLCADFFWHQGGGVQQRPVSGLRGPAMSRPLLEWTVRRRVAKLPNVDVRGEADVQGLTIDRAGERLTGVRVDGVELRADLVVDATGRAARTVGWVQELGFPEPRVSSVVGDTRYVSRTYRRTEHPKRDWTAAAVIGDPETRRLAMLLPLEGDRWIIAVAGMRGEVAPLDHEGMVAYLRGFDSPVIADVLAASEPLGDAVTHRFPSNRRRHVEGLRRFPLGWVLLGDAVCSFNPIYGQGMTSAAMQAVALGAALDAAGAVDRSFARRYFRSAGRIVRDPWSIAVGGDFAYPDTEGTKPFGTDLLNRYLDRVVRAGQRDDEVVIRFNEVVSLVRRPEALLSPAFALRVLRNARLVDAADRRPSLDAESSVPAEQPDASAVPR